MNAYIGKLYRGYRIEAAVVSMGNESPHEYSPDGGGVALMLEWRCPETGGVLHIIVTAEIGSAAAVGMCGLEVGDVVIVEGDAQQLAWPGVVKSEMAVMRNLRDIELVRRRPGAQDAAEVARRSGGA